MVFAICRKKGISAPTAAPPGMGVAFPYFNPTGLSFEEYFKVKGHEQHEQYARFIAGVMGTAALKVLLKRGEIKAATLGACILTPIAR